MRGRRALDAACVCAAFALGLAVFLLRQRQIAGPVGLPAFPLDDSWIHLQFARNLAEGRGFAYNPGVPVAGSTAPLWTLLLAGAFVLVGSEPVLAKGLGAAGTLIAALLARGLAEVWTERRGLGLLAGILTALSGPMLWGALSGMEVSLAALLVTAGILGHASGKAWLAAGMIGLAALARPEAVVLVPLLWLAGPLTAGRTLGILGTAAACLTPWVTFNLATVGSLLPATAAAKIKGGLIGFLSGLHEPLRVALVWRPREFEVEWIEWLWSVNVLLPILLLPGLWWLSRRWGRPAALPASVLLIHPLAMALLAPFYGPAFQEGRYSIHLLPLALVVAVAALALIPDGAGRWARALRGAVALALLVAAGAALPAAAARYAWAVENIESMQVFLGRWVATHTPPQARLGLNDVGAIVYLSRREVVDLMGLVTPSVIPYRREGRPGLLRYIEHACPDYLIIFPAWFPEISAMSDRFTPILRVRLEHNTVAGADEMVVYETEWNRWRSLPRPCPAGEVARSPR